VALKDTWAKKQSGASGQLSAKGKE